MLQSSGGRGIIWATAKAIDAPSKAQTAFAEPNDGRVPNRIARIMTRIATARTATWPSASAREAPPAIHSVHRSTQRRTQDRLGLNRKLARRGICMSQRRLRDLASEGNNHHCQPGSARILERCILLPNRLRESGGPILPSFGGREDAVGDSRWVVPHDNPVNDVAGRLKLRYQFA